MAVQKNARQDESNAKGGTTAADSAVIKAAILITMLSVDELKPSRWNPNVMTQEEYATYAHEVKTQGRIPKPIVVIKTRSGYVIVDGEHAWRAAKDAGLTHVPCEIIGASKFELMRQTLVRNRHGRNDPIRLGRLYALMMKAEGLSFRKLAKRIRVADGTVRNQLLYVKAAKVRNRYAPNSLECISALHVNQVRLYLDIPNDKRNEWLDKGANVEEGEKLKPPKATKPTAKAETNAAPAAEDKVDDVAGSEDVSTGTEDSETEAPETNSTVTEDGDAVAADEPASEEDNKDSADEGTEEVEPASEPYDPGILSKLEMQWFMANTATRKKFVAGILADAEMLGYVRSLFQQGA